jgi:threonylcarbamoyladenosine tRNA methylthiotransferase MtaB
MKSISFYTLGCKLNYSETSTISQQMKAAGYETVDFHEGADIYVINTCSVTENADRKCKRVVREAKKKNADAKVVIIGCYAQLKPKEIATIPGVDMVLGAAEKFNLIQHISKLDESSAAIVINENIKETNVFVPGFSIGERTRSFLKVQDGCDYFCSFCTIPLARGKSRSASIEETIQSAKKVAKPRLKRLSLLE